MTTVLPSFKTVQIRYTLLHICLHSVYKGLLDYRTYPNNEMGPL